MVLGLLLLLAVPTFHSTDFVASWLGNSSSWIAHRIAQHSPTDPAQQTVGRRRAADVAGKASNANSTTKPANASTASSASAASKPPPVHTSPEDHCIHMHEIRFKQNVPFQVYRNIPLNDPFTAVPFFHRILEEYSDLHRRHYHSHHLNFTQDLLSPTVSSKTKYIYVSLDVSGLGNRLMTLISSFMLAVLTKRVLLVSSIDFDMDELLCQPFHGSNWIWPTQLTLEEVREAARLAYDSKKMLDFPGAEPCHIEAHLSGRAAVDRNDQRKLEDYHILYFTNGEMYFLPMLYLNPQYRAMMNKWFPEQNPGTFLARYLLHPRDDVWKDIVETYTTLRSYDGEPTTEGEGRDERWVGVEGANPPPTKAPTPKGGAAVAMNATEEPKALTLKTPEQVPILIGLQLRNTQYEVSWNCLINDEHNHFFRQFHSNPNQRYHIFMSSMFPIVRQHLRLEAEKFPIKNMPENWKFFQEYKDADEPSIMMQVKHSLHDMWLLSMSDELILTPRSTFGYMAMLLRGHAALYPISTSRPYCPSEVDTRMVPLSAFGSSAAPHLKGIPSCYRAKSTEACYHRAICGHYNYTDIDFLSRCEDMCEKNGNQEVGWKLLNNL